MAQPLSPITRQPFAVLGDARLRAVDSVKNKQNGLSATTLKRRINVSESLDSENIDPLSIGSPSKRAKNHLQSDVYNSPEKLNFVAKPSPLRNPVKRQDSDASSSTPVRSNSFSTPHSAPLRAPAGRSPKSKPRKAFGRRSLGYCRVDPPSMSSKQNVTPKTPFSIADALNGTFKTPQPLSETKVSSAFEKANRKAWTFEIYADTKQDEMANLMEHSTCVLDISDDEGRGCKDDRGKENIPPNEQSGQMGLRPISSSETVQSPRTVEMADNPRSPLGELDAKSFVPEGEHVSNSLQIPEEDEDEVQPSKKQVYRAAGTSRSNGKATSASAQPELLPHSAISALIESATPISQKQSETSAKVDEPAGSINSPSEVEIWESASAAEEAEPAVETTTVTVSDNCA